MTAVRAAAALAALAVSAAAQEGTWTAAGDDERAWVATVRRLGDAAGRAQDALGSDLSRVNTRLEYQRKRRFDPDGFVDFALKSCAPGLVYEALHSDGGLSGDEKAFIGRLADLLRAVGTPRLPYLSRRAFEKAVGSDDLEESSEACRRATTDLEALRFLDGREPDRRAEDGHPLSAFLASAARRPGEDVHAYYGAFGDRVEAYFPDYEGAERLAGLLQYKSMDRSSLFEDRPDLPELRCRLAEAFQWGFRTLGQGDCDSLYED